MILIVKKLSQQIQRHKSAETIAAMSFYLSLCMAPLCLLIISLLTLLGLTDKISMTEQIQNIVSPAVIDIINILYRDKTNVLKESFLSSFLSLTLLLFSASLFFNHIKKALRKVFEYKTKQPQFILYVLKQRLVAILLTLIFLITVTASLVLSVLFKSLTLPSFIDFKWIQILGSIIAFFLLFLMVYKITLRSHILLKIQIFGAFLTALILQVGQFLFSYYITMIPMKSVYGPISLFVAFLLWCYLFSASVVIGAEITHFMNKKA
ncbi:MAG: YihY/virulence factor BrkB family protein [Bdellovibrionales bacterium]|nr:YihY/virulence factor BrkB family protein [Bdellovibrionales bacterium]